MIVRRVLYEEVKNIVKASIKEGNIYNKNVILIGLENDGVIESIAGMIIKGSSMTFKCAYTLPQYRHKGNLTLLTKYRLEIAKDLGIKKIYAFVTPLSYNVHIKNGALPVKRYLNGIVKIVYNENTTSK